MIENKMLIFMLYILDLYLRQLKNLPSFLVPFKIYAVNVNKSSEAGFCASFVS